MAAGPQRLHEPTRVGRAACARDPDEDIHGAQATGDDEGAPETFISNPAFVDWWKGRRAFLGGISARHLSRLATLQTDSALLFEGVNNALKLVGDQYLARVYRAVSQRFHLSRALFLARHAGLNLTAHDVYVNVAGGLRIDEPAADLAIAVALASSLRDRPVQPATVLAGEVSLSGRIRSAARAERRLLEASRLGFERLVTGPARGAGGEASRGLVVARDIREALGVALLA